MLPDRFYLTGTDTDVGKTITAAALCAAHGLDYFKPVQSGLDGPTDTEVVTQLSGVRSWPEAYRFQRPASPHASAHDEGRRIDLDAIALPDAPKLLVEGAGGWMVPYADEPLIWQSDLVRHLGLPVVVVARSGLGTLNHTLLTLRAVRADGFDIAGIILVGPPHHENARDLQKMGNVTLLAHLPRVPDLAADFQTLVDAARSAR